MRTIIIASTLCIGLVTLCTLYLLQNETTTDTHHIAIIQTASHPALDAVRSGFIESMQRNRTEPVTITVRNGEGMLPSLEAAAHEVIENPDIDGICAIGTPAAQSVVSHSEISSHKPIAIAAVSDISTLNAPKELNISGIEDTVDTQLQVRGMQALAPNTQHVGIIYTSSEPNAVHMMHTLSHQIKQHGMHHTCFGITHEGDIPAAAEAAFSQTDAIIIPTDNTLANAISLLGEYAQIHRKPFIVSDPWLLMPGVIMACGVDYKATGERAGHMLATCTASSEPTGTIEHHPDNQIWVNHEQTHLLNLSIPEWLSHTICHTGGEQ